MADLEFLSPEGLRSDGRRPHELRVLSCTISHCLQADGSAYLQQGNTRAIATVYGPHDVSRRSEDQHDKAFINCQYSMATFSTSERRKRPAGDKSCLETSLALKKTFEAAILTDTYPHSKIDIFVQILQSDGSDKAVSINAITMALIDAGIPMRDYVCATSVTLINDTPIIDINYIEERGPGPELIVGTLPKSGKIVFLQVNSRLHIDNMDKVLKEGIDGNQRVHRILDTLIKKHLDKSILS